MSSKIWLHLGATQRVICLLLFIVITVESFDGKTSTSPIFYLWNHTKFDQKTMLISKTASSLDLDFQKKYTMVTSEHPFIDYSQAKQSALVLKLLNYKVGGYYVELAANDWKVLSNGLSLETFYNWSGVCIEPNPEYFEGLLSNRKCTLYTNPVSAMSNDKVKFNFEHATSGIIHNDYDNKVSTSSSSATEMLTTTLMSVLSHARAPFEIDFLSLDVEGAEFDVMRHFDFGLYQIKVLSIERPSKHLHNLLSHHGYWWLTQLLTPQTTDAAPIAFGEMIYIHRLLPGFHEFMKSYRENITPLTSYFNGGDASFLLSPAWPIIT